MRQRARAQMLEQQSRGVCINQKLDRVEKKCQTCNKSFFVLPSETRRKFCSRDCGNKGCDKSNMGGYRPNSGRGKCGWYKGFYCQSSWELAWVIYSLEHNIKFERNTQEFEYAFDEKIHKYYPDFKMEDSSYVEVKGYDSSQWQAKKEQFKFKLNIIGKREIKPYIEYVTSKYGTDFIRLYEGNPHNEKHNKCKICGEPCKKICCSRLCSGKFLIQRKISKQNFNGPLVQWQNEWFSSTSREFDSLMGYQFVDKNQARVLIVPWLKELGSPDNHDSFTVIEGNSTSNSGVRASTGTQPQVRVRFSALKVRLSDLKR